MEPDDGCALIESGSRGEDKDDVIVTVPYRYRYYSLPVVRYLNAVRFVLVVDAILSITLWAAGGDGRYFVDSIIHYKHLHSVLDLVILALLKSVVLFVLYTKLEDVSLKVLKDPAVRSHTRRKFNLHVFIISLSSIFLSYIVTKAGLVLNAFLNDPEYDKMNLLYNVLVICTATFALVQVILAGCSFHAMKVLQHQRVLHRLDDNFKEVDEEGKTLGKSSKVNLVRLVSLVKKEGRMLASAIFFLLGSTAAQTASPLFFGMVVDAALTSMAQLNRTVLILLMINIGGAIMSTGRSWLFTLAGQRMVARLRKDLFKSILLQEIAFFDVNRTGELTNRLASDTQVLQNAVTVNISMLARNTLQIIGSLVFMFILKPSLTGVLLAVVPIISLGAVQYGKFVQGVRKEFQDRLADASTTAEESLSSVRTVRSFVGEQRSVASYGHSVDQSYLQGKRLAMAIGSFEGVIGLIIAGAIALVLWYGGKLISEGTLSAGVLTSFLLYMMNVAFAFGLLSTLWGDFMQAVGASVRIFELFDRMPEIPNEGGLELADFEGGIQFEDVVFTYPSRPDTTVLKGVSFHVQKGEVVALVGPSGGGKSTIFSLIQRFYDPDSGTVKLGDTDLKLLDPQWFRRKMATVSQEPTLFACSIHDNILYGCSASATEVEAAAKQANAHEFILTFEEKYDTRVGERGVRLSGGQKQRVAIARALIMNPDILLLDEATSALDAESEHLVQEAIDRAMVNRTVLVIAHRLSTVRNAHKVIVVDKGQIAEQGTHDQLLAKNGVYKRLVLRQLMAGQTNTEQDTTILDGDQIDDVNDDGDINQTQKT